MNRPSLSKRPAQSSSSPSKPSLESSVYAKLHDALALLPQRRSSPTKPSSSTLAPRRSPFSIFSSSRHKPSASSPAQLPSAQQQQQQQQQPVGKALPPQKPIPTTPPPVPPKSAPASRTVTPMVLPAAPATVASTPQPQPSKSRPTIPFIRSSTLMQPTAASSARFRPAVSSPSPSSASTVRASTHTRTLSKSRPEQPLSPTASSPSTSADGKTPTLISSRSRMSPSPTPQDPKGSSSPTLLSRPRPANRTTTSPPPSAFPIKSVPRSLPRKRSKTFPDPSDPAPPVSPPPSSSQAPSRSMNTANRIIEAFDPSPRMNDAPEPFSPRSKSTSPIPIRPPRPSQETDFRLIPSRSRPQGSHRIVPSTSSIEAAASRPRPIASSLNDRSNGAAARGLAPVSTSAPNGRSSLDRGLPPPPRKTAVSPTLTSTGDVAQKRRLARPNLQPIQTTPITSKNVSTNAVKPPSPVTPDTQPSSPSPRTPAPYVDAMSASAYLTSDDETKPKKRPGLKNIFRRPTAQQQQMMRPESMISAATLTSAVSYSGTSAVAYSSPPRPQLPQKGPGTFGDVMEEDEMPMCSMQTRRGILRHGHPVTDVPYPISFEEMVLQGEKHTHELLSTVCQQKAFHFTPMENFAKLKNILDLGCGRGIWLAEAAKECKHANLVGFDLVNVFMKPNELRNKHGLNDSQIARIEFVQGNFFNTLPFPADHFDYIRLAFLELAIPEPKWVPLLKEAWRVLRPGGNLEVVIESQLFPTVWSYDKLPVQTALEEEFNAMLEKRNIPPPTNIGEKMYFDAHARVKTHQHVSIRIAPRSAGRSSLDGPASPRNFGSMRSMHSPWSSEPLMSSGMVSPPPFGRPSLDRSGSSLDVLPPAGHVITSKTCTVPGIIIAPDTFIPVSEEMLYAYASHSALILNATRLASFSDKYPDASLDDYQDEWREHWERYWQYERTNRLRLGFRMNQFDDDDDIVPAAPSRGRWRWEKCDDDLERPLEIRRFRAWSLTKPMPSR